MNSKPDELKIELRGENEVVFTRYFAAPRELVFECFTKPELMRRWLLGPDGKPLEIVQNDLKVGGKYLYVCTMPDGKKMGVYGTFRGVVTPETLANTENYAMDMAAFDLNAPEDPNASVERRTFTQVGDGTLLTHVCRFGSDEERRLTLESGMSEGWKANCLELDKLLEEIA